MNTGRGSEIVYRLEGHLGVEGSSYCWVSQDWLVLACKMCAWIHLSMLLATPFLISLTMSPSIHTLSNARCMSIQETRLTFFSWNASSISCAKYVVWSSVARNCRNHYTTQHDNLEHTYWVEILKQSWFQMG